MFIILLKEILSDIQLHKNFIVKCNKNCTIKKGSKNGKLKY